MAYWQQCGVDTIVSLLEVDEEHDLGLQSESAAACEVGITYRSLPLKDRGVPVSRTALSERSTPSIPTCVLGAMLYCTAVREWAELAWSPQVYYWPRVGIQK